MPRRTILQGLRLNSDQEAPETGGEDEEFDYERLRQQVRTAVSIATAPGSTILVVSRGDTGLVDIEDRRGWHFPRDEVGRHSGHLPHSAAAIAHIEQQRERGADYLVFPATELWWLEYYAELAWHLETSYRTIRDDACVIFELRAPEEPARGFLESLVSFLESITPVGATVAVAAAPDEPLPPLPDRLVRRFSEPVSTAGHHEPPDPTALIEQLEQCREEGASFLVIPSTTALTLDGDFVGWLDQRYWRVARQAHLCSLYELVERDSSAPARRGLAAKLSAAWSAAAGGRRPRGSTQSSRRPSDA